MYWKGPDVMSKSDQTWQRHAKAFQGQGQLTAFGFKAPSYPARVLGPKTKAAANPPVLMQDVQVTEWLEPQAQLIAQPHSSMSLDAPSQIGRPVRTRSATVLSDPSTEDEAVTASSFGDVAEKDVPKNDDLEYLADNMNVEGA